MTRRQLKLAIGRAAKGAQVLIALIVSCVSPALLAQNSVERDELGAPAAASSDLTSLRAAVDADCPRRGRFNEAAGLALLARLETEIGLGGDLAKKCLDALRRNYRRNRQQEELIALGERVLRANRTRYGSDSLEAAIANAELQNYKGPDESSEQTILALIDRLEAETGLGTELARQWGDRLRSNYSTQRRFRDQIALLERFLRSNQARYGRDSEQALDWVIRLGHDLESMERYDEARAYFERSLGARRRLKAANPTNDTYRDLIDAGRALANFSRSRKRYDDAERYWLEVIEISTEQSGESHRRTIEWMDFLSRVYGESDQFTKQSEILRRMIELRKAAFGNDDWPAMRAQQTLVDSLDNAGRPEEALKELQPVLAFDARRAEPGNALDLLTNDRLASLLSRLRRFDELEKLYLEDLAEVRSLGNKEIEILPLLSLGKLKQDTGEYAEAEGYLLEAVSVQESYRPDDPFRDDLKALSQLYVFMGRLGEAEATIRRAYDIDFAWRRSRSRVEDKPNYGLLATLASVVLQQGNYAEAERLLLDGLSYNEPDHVFEGLRSVLASLYTVQGSFDQAIPLLERLRDVPASDERGYSGRLAQIYVLQGRLSEADAIFASNLEHYSRSFGENDHLALQAKENLANVYRLQGRLTEAETLIRELIQSRSEGFDLTNLELRNLLALTLSADGRNEQAAQMFGELSKEAFANLGETNPNALTIMQNAVDVAGYARNDIAAFESSKLLVAGLSARRRALSDEIQSETQLAASSSSETRGYLSFVEAAWRVSDDGPVERDDVVTDIFAALQNAMSGVTDRAIARGAARQIAEKKDGTLGALARRAEELQELREDLNRTIAQSFTERTEAAFQLRRRKVAERETLDAEFTRLNAEIEQRFPEYFALVRADPVTLEKAGELLRSDEAAVLLVPGPDATHAIAISDGELRWHRSSWNAAKVSEAVSSLRKALDQDLDANSGSYSVAFDRALSHALYSELIAPLEAALEGKDHVFIAASGALSSLPPAVLVTETPRGDDSDPKALRGTDWFDTRHALVQIPSLQSLKFLRELSETNSTQVQRQLPFQGFGAPDLKGRRKLRDVASSEVAPSTSRGNLADVTKLSELEPLSGAVNELRNLASSFGYNGREARSYLRIQAEAREGAVKEADLSNTRVIAFATHGLLAGEIDGITEPGLVFTPPAQSEASELDDGYLTATEVVGLELGVDWVILSACNTAAGETPGAPGLSGLARAFFYAGARALLATHWRVRDDVASEIVPATIAATRENSELSRARAFNSAMQSIRADTTDDSKAHPAAWAPFVLIGDR